MALTHSCATCPLPYRCYERRKCFQTGDRILTITEINKDRSAIEQYVFRTLNERALRGVPYTGD